MTFTDKERAKAESLFDSQMRAKGAYMPGWFPRLHKRHQEMWLRAAKKMLREMV